jgi:eukaryotic-like serine/threonine-protein kinase
VLDRIGNCRILSEIASGGMAVVYKAVQESLNRTVAIKALKTSVAADSQFAIRFEREALSLAQLQHENIIHVYDFHKERGAYFIVMEMVDGVDLYDLLDRVGRLPIDVAAIIGMQVARALDYAHYRGIVHRDIKPANIMVARSGGVKLMDFGIARDQSFGDLTQTGTGLGTPSYMSPEQILGDKIDFRSDIFSLGIVLYQMCTGRKPFIEDEQKSVMHKIRLEKHPNPRKLNPDMPRELEKILARCMAKVPRDRWRSTQDLVLALERFLSRRVDMNYHARVVQYLTTSGVVSAEEAEQFLHPAAAGQAPSAPGRAAARDMIRRVAAIQGIIAGASALMVGLIHLAPVGIPAALPVIQANVPQQSAPAAKLTGKVRIVANPWANVYVDGKLVEVTPFSTPLELEAGEHKIVFKNPYFAEATREVTIPANEEAKPVVITLTGRKLPPRPPDVPAVEARSDVKQPRIVHAARKGDTLEILAAEYYGTRDFAVFLMLANGMAHPRPLRLGEKLAIPTAWKYRIAEGDTLSGLAQRYLGDPRRAAFLAEFNKVSVEKSLSIGDELTIPYHATHMAAAPEDLAAIAAAYYRDRSKAELLRKYNFRANAKPLTKGESLIVPIVDVHARMPEDPEAEKRAKRQREMMSRAKDALPRAEGAWDAGDYAGVRSALVDLDSEYLDSATATTTSLLLGASFVALGDRDSALRELRRIHERRPDLVLRADEHSPKIRDEWKRAGGKVDEPR